MTLLMEAKNTYLSQFESLAQEANGTAPPWFAELRRKGLDGFRELGFPTTDQEDWIHTSVKEIAEGDFRRFAPAEFDDDLEDAIYQTEIVGLEGYRLAFVDGRYVGDSLSVIELPVGAEAGSLAEEVHKGNPTIERHLGSRAQLEKSSFAALNTAFMEDGAFIHIADGIVLDRPIELLYLWTGREAGTMANPRNLIVVGKNSQVSIVERHLGLAEAPTFTNEVTEVFVGENSVVHHAKLEEESPAAFHIATLEIQQERSSQYHSGIALLGGKLVRNDIRGLIAGEGIETHLKGLYVANDRQHIDTHTYLDHAEPNCHSDELYKGILDGHARGVFNGTIHVWKKAQKTDAIQANRNLLLSDTALVNSQPQLEIFADDVRCTHGSTVGQMDKDALFYLESRGIAPAEAFAILTHAFAGEVVNEFKEEAIRNYLHAWLIEHFEAKALAGAKS